MADTKVNAALLKARNKKYDSHYTRMVQSSLDNFDAIVGVRESNFNTALGAALESNTKQTITSMQISDEEFVNLEKKLKALRTKTSNTLADKKDVGVILAKALGKDIINDEQIESLISSVENKFSEYVKVKDALAKKNLNINADAYSNYKKRNDVLTAETIKSGAEGQTIFKTSMANRVSEGFGRVHTKFVEQFPDNSKAQNIAVQSISLLSVAFGIAAAGGSKND